MIIPTIRPSTRLAVFAQDPPTWPPTEAPEPWTPWPSPPPTPEPTTGAPTAAPSASPWLMYAALGVAAVVGGGTLFVRWCRGHPRYGASDYYGSTARQKPLYEMVDI